MTDFIDLQQLDDDARWVLLGRHVAGETTPAEDSAVRSWLAADPRREQELAAVRAAADDTRWSAPEGLDVEAALAKVHARMRGPQVVAIDSRSGKRADERADTFAGARIGTRTGTRRWLPYAAAATLMLAAGLGWFLKGSPVENAARTVATAVGQRDSLELPDGSRVILGPGSRLVVAAAFAEGRREVELEGEALFTVVHDDAHPFIVIAGDARIVDVGTEFTVRHAPGDVEVAVLEGIVDVSVGGTAAARLNAGDRALVAAGAAPIVRRGDVTDDDAALRRGALVFREAAMTRVIADLARWYGVRVVAASEEIAERHVTATFTTEGRDEVIALLSLALGVSAESYGDSVVLRPQTLRRIP